MNTSPTPRLDSLPEEQERTVSHIVIVGALILIGVVVLVIVLVLLVIGILISKPRKKRALTPKSILHEDFETHYHRGMWMYM